MRTGWRCPVSNQHITAALKCSKFEGVARLLLFVLADSASLGPKDGKGQPFGYCYRTLQFLMSRCNKHRQQTVSAGLKELREAGAITVHYKKGGAPLFFVDLDWLQDNAQTEEQYAEFEYEALKVSRKALKLNLVPRQRKPAKLHNANRLSSTTKTVVLDNANRLTGLPIVDPTVSQLFSQEDKSAIASLIRQEQEDQHQPSPQPCVHKYKTGFPGPKHPLFQTRPSFEVCILCHHVKDEDEVEPLPKSTAFELED